MDISLTSIPQEEVLRYLGCGERADQNTRALALQCSGQLLSAIRPKATWIQLEILGEECCVRLPGYGLTLPGKDLARHLAGCRTAVLMAATLGAAADTLIRRWQVEELARGVVLDCCATAAVEELCDRTEEKIMAGLPGYYFTSRFSPGYGDLPISLQEALLSILDAPRKIGLCATRASILTPRKSVTALLGVSERPLSRGRRSCTACPLHNTCQFRRKEEHCGL